MVPSLLTFRDSCLPEDQLRTLYQFSFFFIISFVIPALYVVLIMKKSLIDFGLGIGNIKNGLITLIVIPGFGYSNDLYII